MKVSLVTLDNRTAADKEFTKPRVVSGNVDGSITVNLATKLTVTECMCHSTFRVLLSKSSPFFVHDLSLNMNYHMISNI